MADLFEVDALVGEKVSYDHAGCTVNLSLARVFGFDSEITRKHTRDVGLELLFCYVKFHTLSFPSAFPRTKETLSWVYKPKSARILLCTIGARIATD